MFLTLIAHWLNILILSMKRRQKLVQFQARIHHIFDYFFGLHHKQIKNPQKFIA